MLMVGKIQVFQEYHWEGGRIGTKGKERVQKEIYRVWKEGDRVGNSQLESGIWTESY